MVFQTLTLASAAFKKGLGKTHTGNTKDPANEAIASDFTIAAQSVFGERISPTPATAVSAGVAVDCTGSNKLNLIIDPSSSGKAYFTSVPTGSPLLSYVNPITGVNFIVGDRVGNIIPQKFGDNYRPILKSSGVEVAPLAAQDWFCDTAAGVVVSEDNLSLVTGTLDCYVYVGQYLTDVLDNLDSNSGGNISLQFAFGNGQDIDLDGYQNLTIHSEVDGYGVLIDTKGDSRFHSDGYVDLNGELALRFSDANNTQVRFSNPNETFGANLLTSRQSIIGAINEAFLAAGNAGKERAVYEVLSSISAATGFKLDGSQAEVSLISGSVELIAPEGYQFSFVANVYIYVNGSLMINDSATGITPTKDVIWNGTDRLYFAFDLSPGDTIQVVNLSDEI
jgi:hypothetical protein